MKNIILYLSSALFISVLFASCSSFSVPKKNGLDFPIDHGNHAEAQTEWWYLQSIIHTADGHRLSLFISAFRHNPKEDWFLWLPLGRLTPGGNAVLFFGCVVDLDSGEVIAERWAPQWTWNLHESNNHGSFEIKKGLWQISGHNGSFTFAIPTKIGSMQVRVTKTSAPLLIGSPTGQANEVTTGYHKFLKAEFNYYSYPRAKVTGHFLTRNNTMSSFWGEGWFDHQYGFIYSNLYKGWWWAGIMLDDGSDLLLTKVTALKKNVKPVILGVIRRPGQATKMLGRFTFKPIKFWQSKRTKARYPIEVDVVSEDKQINLKLTALRKSMEWDVEPAWIWEGPVKVDGTVNSKPVKGKGFAEFLEQGDRLARYFYKSGK